MTYITAYQPLPISFARGEGIWLYDAQGNAYMDTFSGIGVCNLGHAHPEITKTIQEQAAKLIHTSNMVHIPQQEQLAEKLTQITGMQQAFFCNSGAEANEAAIKLSRLYGHQQGIDKPSIIVMDGAFHGRTMATITASGNRKVQAGFEPLLPGFIRAPYNDLEAVHTIAANRDDIVAIMLEPIQGESGIIPGETGYLQALHALCKTHNWLLIMDEVQTGNGRTGNFYEILNLNLSPDILTTAKGLGNGIPIGACLMRDNACDLFKPGNHGSTFGGGPLASATALKVLEVLERDKLCENSDYQGKILKDKLVQALSEHPHVKSIRGKGLMIGIEMTQPISDIRLTALKHGLVLNVTNNCVIRLLPPLIMQEQDVEKLVERLLQTIDAYFNVN